MFNKNIILLHLIQGGRNSAVGKATSYGLDGPDIESIWGEFFRFIQIGSGIYPASITKGTGSFPGVKRSGRGVEYEFHLAPRLKEE